MRRILACLIILSIAHARPEGAEPDLAQQLDSMFVSLPHAE
jgi:hypothetical protein